MASSSEHRFGTSALLSLGVEEELLLIDEQRRLQPSAERVIADLDPSFAAGVSTEIFATEIELKTGICSGPAQALEELSALRRGVRAAGANLLGSGLHPDDKSAVRLVAKPRYDVVKEDLAGILNATPAGLHVHVGMPDPETAVRVANAMRLRLPLLEAITANSPFREGFDTGLASARTASLRSYPRFEIPRSFADYEEFLAVADQLITAAGVADYTYLWWDVRPHPRFGTVEVRGMDVQPDVATNVAIAALIQALAAREIERPTAVNLRREAIEESYFQAERHGLRARLMLDEGTAMTAVELGTKALEEARPHARELGSEDALEEIERILREGNGADEQRRVHAEGGIEGLLGHLVERTN
ncbi:MAG: glutamate---cysteine ligase / carboxylate-amine ligase [Solirubrobacterales bacterium]|jgi:carboxylate-amine ligase|nr:glutamate---cysteine ligase / carboxylate-amine ligase [Solirubrobacterales bacterium]